MKVALCNQFRMVRLVVPMGIDDFADSWVILIGVANLLAKRHISLALPVEESPALTWPWAAAGPVISCFALAASHDARPSHSTGLDHP